MPKPNHSVHPVQIVRESAIRLEAAVLECLAKPKKKAVHSVRTTTRRMEAQLELLSLLPELPRHEREARRLARVLKKLRRAAGQVRDLDVQRDLIQQEASNGSHREIRKEAKQLRRELKSHHKQEAQQLTGLLRKLSARLPRAVEELLHTLAPADSVSITEVRLTALVRGWYRDHAEPLAAAARRGDAEQLHGIRKVAKLARYLAETAPQSANTARRLAKRLEAMQEAGGSWHDFLVLNEIAQEELGAGARLPARFAGHADHALGEFQRRLSSRI